MAGDTTKSTELSSKLSFPIDNRHTITAASSRVVDALSMGLAFAAINYVVQRLSFRSLKKSLKRAKDHPQVVLFISEEQRKQRFERSVQLIEKGLGNPFLLADEEALAIYLVTLVDLPMLLPKVEKAGEITTTTTAKPAFVSKPGLEKIVEFLVRDPALLRLVLLYPSRIHWRNTAESISTNLIEEVRELGVGSPAVQVLNAAAANDSNVSEILARFASLHHLSFKDNGPFQFLPYQRSLTKPSTMRLASAWSSQIFLGTAIGGLIGTLIAGPMGSAIGGVAGALTFLGLNLLYNRLSRYLRRDLASNPVQTNVPERSLLGESNADVPFLARFAMGFVAGATLGGAWGTFAPGIGNLLGSLLGGLLVSVLALASPFAFKFVRRIGEFISAVRRKNKKTGALAAVFRSSPPKITEESERYWFSNSADIPWYIRFFAGVMGGVPMGVACGTFLGSFVVGASIVSGALFGTLVVSTGLGLLALLQPVFMAIAKSFHRRYQKYSIDTRVGLANFAKAMLGLTTCLVPIGIVLGITGVIPTLGVVSTAWLPLLMTLAVVVTAILLSAMLMARVGEGIPARADAFDIPAIFRFAIGSSVGAVMGAALGVLIPGVGQMVGMLCGTIIVSTVTSVWPIFRDCSRELFDGSTATTKTDYQSAITLKLPTYVRLLTGVLGGNFLGVIIGAAVLAIAGGGFAALTVASAGSTLLLAGAIGGLVSALLVIFAPDPIPSPVIPDNIYPNGDPPLPVVGNGDTAPSPPPGNVKSSYTSATGRLGGPRPAEKFSVSPSVRPTSPVGAVSSDGRLNGHDVSPLAIPFGDSSVPSGSPMVGELPDARGARELRTQSVSPMRS